MEERPSRAGTGPVKGGGGGEDVDTHTSRRARVPCAGRIDVAVAAVVGRAAGAVALRAHGRRRWWRGSSHDGAEERLLAGAERTREHLHSPVLCVGLSGRPVETRDGRLVVGPPARQNKRFLR